MAQVTPVDSEGPARSAAAQRPQGRLASMFATVRKAIISCVNQRFSQFEYGLLLAVVVGLCTGGAVASIAYIQLKYTCTTTCSSSPVAYIEGVNAELNNVMCVAVEQSDTLPTDSTVGVGNSNASLGLCSYLHAQDCAAKQWRQLADCWKVAAAYINDNLASFTSWNTTQQLLSQKALLGGCAFTSSLLSDYACMGWHQSMQSNSTTCIRIGITAPEQHPAYVAAAPTAFQAGQSSCSTAKGDTSCAHTHCEVQIRPSDATTATGGSGGTYPRATAYAAEKLYQCCQYIPGGFSLCYSTDFSAYWPMEIDFDTTEQSTYNAACTTAAAATPPSPSASNSSGSAATCPTTVERPTLGSALQSGRAGVIASLLTAISGNVSSYYNVKQSTSSYFYSTVNSSSALNPVDAKYGVYQDSLLGDFFKSTQVFCCGDLCPNWLTSIGAALGFAGYCEAVFAILSITIYLGIRRSEAAALGLNLKQIAKMAFASDEDKEEDGAASRPDGASDAMAVQYIRHVDSKGPDKGVTAKQAAFLIKHDD